MCLQRITTKRNRREQLIIISAEGGAVLVWAIPVVPPYDVGVKVHYWITGKNLLVLGVGLQFAVRHHKRAGVIVGFLLVSSIPQPRNHLWCLTNSPHR